MLFARCILFTSKRCDNIRLLFFFVALTDSWIHFEILIFFRVYRCSHYRWRIFVCGPADRPFNHSIQWNRQFLTQCNSIFTTSLELFHEYVMWIAYILHDNYAGAVKLDCRRSLTITLSTKSMKSNELKSNSYESTAYKTLIPPLRVRCHLVCNNYFRVLSSILTHMSRIRFDWFVILFNESVQVLFLFLHTFDIQNKLCSHLLVFIVYNCNSMRHMNTKLDKICYLQTLALILFIFFFSNR